MDLVIIGIGKVGETLVESLTRENHAIVVIDSEYETVDAVVNRYDVRGIVGSGLERDVLRDAGADKADFLIACTPRDEMNILCCVLAKKLGARHTIARVRDPDLFAEMENMRTELGIDFAFNPELTTALEIANVLKFPSARNVESFAGGRARMAEFELGAESPLVGKALDQIAREYGNDFLIGAVKRGDKVNIPHGDFILQKDDTISVIASEERLTAFCKKLRIFKSRARSVFIVGGGKIGYYLARELLEAGVGVKLLERDAERAEELSEQLPRATVLAGDGTEQEVLDEENLKACDACITLTGMDEVNVMISLYAKQSKVDKIITKIDRPSILKTVRMLGLDTVVTPRIEIANHIVRFVRAYQSGALVEDEVDTLYRIGARAEALEFTVPESFSGNGVPLKDLPLKKNVLVGGIVRDGTFILPDGGTSLCAGDRVIVLSEDLQITRLAQTLRGVAAAPARSHRHGLPGLRKRRK